MLINIAETLKGRFNWPSLCGPGELLSRTGKKAIEAEMGELQALGMHLTRHLTLWRGTEEGRKTLRGGGKNP